MANNGEDDDDDDSDEDEDEGVLNHALAFLIVLLLTNHEFAQTQIQIVKHFRFHLLYPGIECRLRPGFFPATSRTMTPGCSTGMDSLRRDRNKPSYIWNPTFPRARLDSWR
jgi:hypothetical protein